MRGLELGKFQDGGWHHRLRDGENYAVKWRYVRENPIRHGLVERIEDWPYFGRAVTGVILAARGWPSPRGQREMRPPIGGQAILLGNDFGAPQDCGPMLHSLPA